MPKLTSIPTCFFGSSAAKYWSIKDYGEPQAANRISPEEYQDMISNSYKLEENDIYRYPRCQKFSPKPSDTGICQTFNGLGIHKILKPSTWTNAFLSAFGSNDDENILKSEGIDLHDGFVFSLDTLQSYLIGLNKRSSDQRDVNAFYIKVHSAGEIPWITQDKSSWKKILPFTNEMSTRFITLKGEKIEGKVNIINFLYAIFMTDTEPNFRNHSSIFQRCYGDAVSQTREN